MKAYGETKAKLDVTRESLRNPFSLPPGVRLHSKDEPVSPTKGVSAKLEAEPVDIPLKLKAILISDHIRLASIDRIIVTVGDSIYDEKVLEIKPDRVVLDKGGKRRTILLDQSPVKLIIEER